jgi:hypothetical protein
VRTTCSCFPHAFATAPLPPAALNPADLCGYGAAYELGQDEIVVGLSRLASRYLDFAAWTSGQSPCFERSAQTVATDDAVHWLED